MVNSVLRPAPQRGGPKSANLRRSTRLTIALPIVVSGQDAQGNSFTEQTKTIVVNKQGGRVFLHREVRLKDTLSINNPNLKCTVRAQVVWLGKPRTPADPWEVAVELLEPQNIWGVSFPPNDWEETPSQSEAATGGSEPSPLSVSGLPPEQTSPTVISVPVAGNPLPASVLPAPAPVAAVSASSAPIEEKAVQQSPPAAPAPFFTSKEAKYAASGSAPSPASVKRGTEPASETGETQLARFEADLKRMAETHLKVVERRLLEIGVQHVEEVRKQSREAALGAAPELLAELRRQAQRDLEDLSTHLEYVRAQFQESIPGLIREATAELRQQLAQDTEKLSAQVEEAKQKVVNDALSTLRQRLSNALKALSE